MSSCPMIWFANFMSAVGAINWGLVAFLRFNLVEFMSNIIPIPYLELALYSIIAVCGIYSLLFMFMNPCAVCK
ncbi:DUF378 domain-containing protein [Candidatus Dependentiae bacterium]|nr:DUF378 domain-containing protein [Candidatus Dependentiae bacterium]